MADFLGIDRFQSRNSVFRPGLAENLDHAGRHVEPARLQHHRHHRQPGQQVMRRILGGAPHEGMGGQRPVMASHRLKTVSQKVEMLGFLVARLHPVVVEAERHRDVGEAGDDIPVQIDRVQLDMGDGVQQRDPSLGRAGAAARNLARRQKLGLVRPGRAVRWRGAADIERRAGRARREPDGRMAPRQRRLGARIAGAQHLLGHRGQTGGFRHPVLARAWMRPGIAGAGVRGKEGQERGGAKPLCGVP